MAFRDELNTEGNWLFRWRSYLPLLLATVVLAGFTQFNYPFGRHSLDLLWEFFCISISFTGLAVRIHVSGHVPPGTSGRNTTGQVAETLNTTGFYSIVRHPLYLGNFIIWLGISLFAHKWWIAVIFTLVFWLYYERIIFAEEEFLRKKFGQDFEEWAASVPVFIPRLRGWKKSTLPFSWKAAIAGEYAGFYAIIIIFTFLEIVSEIYLNRQIWPDIYWKIAFIASSLIYLIIRILKKKTCLLTHPGR